MAITDDPPVTFATDQELTLDSGLGTARLDFDYTIGSTTLTLEAGETSVSTEITVLDDTEEEPPESVELWVRHDGTSVGVPSALIVDNDQPPSAVVPHDWGLIPAGFGPGDRFRLIFLTSEGRDAAAPDIEEYDAFVQGRASGGHADIQPYARLFKVLGSTAAVDARDHTETTYTSSDKGVPVYWLGGNRVADDYEDFYDGEWADEVNRQDASGNASTHFAVRLPFTGSAHDGTGVDGRQLGAGSGVSRTARLADPLPTPGPISSSANVSQSSDRPFYGLSAVFTVAAVPTAVPESWGLLPGSLGPGDRFRLLFVSSTTRDGSSDDIADYNTHVRDAAAAGHADIRAYAPLFNAVGSTADVDARDNTQSGHTSAHKGVPIYWLGSSKAADDYEDFYNGSWDDETNAKDESGAATAVTADSGYPFTGSGHQGVEAIRLGVSRALGGTLPRAGKPGSEEPGEGPIDGGAGLSSSDTRAFYALSPVLQVGTPVLSVGDSSASEAAGTLDFEVTLTLASTQAITVQYQTAGGTATQGTDYSAASGTLTFAAGETRKTVSVPVTDDMLHESEEQFTLTLTSPAGATLEGGVASLPATGTIADNDMAPTGIALGLNPDSVREDGGAQAVDVTAALVGTLRGTATEVTVSRTGGTATSGTDYAAVSSFTVTIPAMERSGTATLTFTPTDDRSSEGPETVVLTAAWTDLDMGTATLTINDDDTPSTAIALSMHPDSVAEDAGATAIEVTAALDGAVLTTATEVTVRRTGGTATPGTDYAALSDFTVTIPANQPSATATLTFTPTHDGVVDAAETVVLSGSATGLAAGTATLTINDVGSTAIALSVHPDSVAEDGGATAIDVTATLNAAARSTATAVTVSRTGGTATPGTDYAALTDTTLTIPAGEFFGTATFTFTPTDDRVVDAAETVVLSGGATGLAAGTATLTIDDNDVASTAIELSLDTGSVAEDAGATQIEVTAALDGAVLATATEVTVSRTEGTAAPGTDYAALGDFTVTIPANQASGTATLTFTPTDDRVVEDGETVVLTGSATGLSGGTATLTIEDNDAATLEATLSPGTIAEGAHDSTATLTVEVTDDPPVTFATDQELTLQLRGDALLDVDYTLSTTLTLEAGETSVSTEITVLDDTDEEPLETLQFRIRHNGTNIGSPSAQIVDNDQPPSAIVHRDWGLIPAGLGPGDRFRLIFLTSEARDAASTHIADYDAFVQGRASDGHADIQPYARLFQVLGSTSAVDARDHTETTYTSSDKGVPVYWLGGNRVADDYEDFYDGEWADEVNRKDASGNASTHLAVRFPFTGSNHDGTGKPGTELGSGFVTAGALAEPQPQGPISSQGAQPNTDQMPFYGLSPVFTVAAVPAAVPESWGLLPDGLGPGDRFRLLFASSTTRDGSSDDIAVYNTHVRDAAAAGHADIRAYAPLFNAVGSTADTDARDNTQSGYTSVHKGVPIHWLDGSKVADDYEDFYNGSWDDETNAKDELGAATAITASSGYPFTGSGHQGVEALDSGVSQALGSTSPWIGAPGSGEPGEGPIDGGVGLSSSDTRQFYALSPVLQVGTPVLSVRDSSASEAAGTLDFEVTLTLASAQAITVQYQTAGGTATHGTDYSAASGTLTFAAGETRKTISVPVTDDMLHESEEQFTLALTGPAGATLEGGVASLPATGTIVDNDMAPTGIALGLNPDSVREDGGAQAVDVTAALVGTLRGTATEVTVSRTGGTADSGTDYAAVSSFTVTIPAMERSGTATLTFTPTDDSAGEGPETVVLTAAWTDLDMGTATLTINDDDTPSTAISLSLDPIGVAEDAGATPIEVTAALDGAVLTTATEVTVRRTGGTAISGTDYAALSDFTVTIPANQPSATATLTFTPTHDREVEAAETVVLSGSATGLAAGTATLTIDHVASTAIALSVHPDSVAEDAGATVIGVTATLNAAVLATATAVTVSRTGGTATPGMDYAALTDTTVTIPAGEFGGTATFTFTPADDREVEAAETVVLSGSATGLAGDAATLTIEDNDVASTAIALSLDPGSVAEGAGATQIEVTAALDGAVLTTATEVTVSRTGGTADPATDYAALSDFTVTIPANQASGTATLTFTPTDDRVVEAAETVVLEGAATGLAKGTATLTIDDNDAATLEATLSPGTIAEGSHDSTATLTVAITDDPPLTFATDQELTLQFFGTARLDFDYTLSTTLTLEAGETSVSTEITVLDDTEEEPLESVELSVRHNGINVGLPGARIVDNDQPPSAIVPHDWGLIPAGLGPGDRFRLIFLTSQARDAASTHIGDYDDFVQGRAADSGHADIQPYARLFKVLGSTSAVDARDHTETTYTSSDKGVPVYWLGGNRVADDYEDFYDGEWDDEVNRNDETGNGATVASERFPFTGSNHDGTGKSGTELGSGAVTAGALAGPQPQGPISSQDVQPNTGDRPFYGLSPVFTVAAAPTAVSESWGLLPDGLGPGDRFRLLFASSTGRDGSSNDIAVYNTHVRDAAAVGHADIRAYASLFNVVGSTADTDARDNTQSGYTSAHKGVPIYWLDGNKAADDYLDFYNGSWDDETNAKNELGAAITVTSYSGHPFTGSDHQGARP